MASDPKHANIDRSDSVRRGTEEARKQVAAKLQQSIEQSKSPAAEAGKSKGKKVSKAKTTKNVALMEEIRKDQDKILKTVKVYSPFKVYFNGEADSVSAESQTGPFDILPGHKNFLTLLTDCEIVIRTTRGKEKIQIDRGIMQVHENVVSVFLDV